MAKPHKKAARAIEVMSSLPPDELAGLCKDAADQCKIRLDQAKQGQLVFSVRAPLSPTKKRLMVFEVRLTALDDGHALRSRITSYRTLQSKFLLLVPMGPKRMVGLATYEKFMQRFGELARHADPQADILITG